ncbi:putative disease resistance protein RGA4 [Chenopodium quinoa]|uniref:putative disease resistance protein RGA4 n=1 Tax=Chenopodium quinoa TaxID=63459 RepID=UPI000B76C0FE|nr:putative disease resistance protein RGA4 [Chenopodium quinoa]
MKEDPSEWRSIEKSPMWSLPEENNNILPSLMLSFNNLPSTSLKQCFAYCAIFPKEVLIDQEDLINLWNAQGFLHCHSEGRNLTPEELGRKYVDILLSSSLLQAATRCSIDGDVTEYRMHYLVHDMALYISRHDWVIWKGVDKVGNPSGGRHLAIFPEDNDITSESPVEKMTWLWDLQTLHSTIRLPMDLLAHAKNLRVLKLAATGLKKVPPAIGRLSHLRYVDLSHNSIVMLPESITSLYHLQTFRLFSYKLRELPQKLYRLVNLRHLYLTSRSWCLPRGIERLTALQTLPMLELNNEGFGWEIGELGVLGDIHGLLSISGLEHVKSKGEAEKAGIHKKKGISELQLIWGWGRASNHLEVLDALQPSPNLKLLMITGYDGPNFPSWMKSMMTLVKLVLQDHSLIWCILNYYIAEAANNSLRLGNYHA